MDISKELKKFVASSEELNREQFRDLYPYIITQKELSKEDIPKRKFVLGEWMPEDSFGMVYANRGVGKSWFCMAMAVAIANGDPTFLGWEIHEKRSVLYVDGEMAKVEIKERFENLADQYLDNLFILSSEMLYRDGKPICLDDVNEQLAIDNVLEKLEQEKTRPQILILDNLSTLRRGINENDNNEAQQLLDWLVSLRHKQYTVIIVHHSGKSGQQRGASIIEVPMDFVIKLDPPKENEKDIYDGAVFNFSFEKIRLKTPKPSTGKLSLSTDQEGNLKLLSSTTDKLPDRKYQILKYLKKNENETKMSIRKIAEKFNIAIGTVAGDRLALIKERLITKKYEVTKEGDIILYEIWPNEFKEPLELDIEPPW